jgi:glyoxylase-like metal-dependent hydrolase (beta-lactamase superfamily II)
LKYFTSAAEIKTQAPGYYRLMIGDEEVTVLFDGFFPMKTKEVLTNLSEKKLEDFLKQTYQSEVIPTSANAFLINTVLVGNLRASGYTPEQVDEIDFTHMHTDHIGGVVANGKAVFPHATSKMDQIEADY